MKTLSVLLLLTLLLSACRSARKDHTAMAEEMCGCFNKILDSLPAQARQLMVEAAEAPKATPVYRAGAARLSEDDLIRLQTALVSISQPGSPAKACIEEMDKRYKTVGGEEKEVTRKMVAALRGKKECALMQTLLRMKLEKP